jgi:hypothetical protein
MANCVWCVTELSNPKSSVISSLNVPANSFSSRKKHDLTYGWIIISRGLQMLKFRNSIEDASMNYRFESNIP